MKATSVHCLARIRPRWFQKQVAVIAAKAMQKYGLAKNLSSVDFDDSGVLNDLTMWQDELMKG